MESQESEIDSFVVKALVLEFHISTTISYRAFIYNNTENQAPEDNSRNKSGKETITYQDTRYCTLCVFIDEGSLFPGTILKTF